MNPRSAIAPTVLVRRPTAKKWHLQDGGRGGTGYVKTFCGQTFQIKWSDQAKTAYNAAEIDCTDCMVSAISRGGAKR